MIPAEIVREAKRAESLHGTGHDLPNGTGAEARHHWPYAWTADTMRAWAHMRCEAAQLYGELDWATVLVEEVTEALAESDPAKLRAELVQVAAVASRWIAAIDTRAAREQVPA